MQRRDKLDELAGQFYDGIASPDEWYAGLEATSQALGGAFFHEMRLRLDDMSVIDACATLEAPESRVLEYEQELLHQDIRMDMVLQSPSGSVALDHEFFEAGTLSRNAVCGDWLPSLGLRHTLAMRLGTDLGAMHVIGVMRDKADGPFALRDKLLCERLIPHLLRATSLKARMSSLAAQAAFSTAVLDALPSAIAIVDDTIRIKFMNASAQLALADNELCRVREGRLCLDDPGHHEVLARAVVSACACHTARRAHSVRFNAASGESLLVLPLRPTHPLAQSNGERPCALLVWTHPNVTLCSEQVAAALGLTETEARLAVMLAQGLNVKEFSRIQGCTWNTARTHARNLLIKTGCHRQAEVIQLVRNLL